MTANPDKFQGIILRNADQENPKPVQQPKCKTVTHGINSFIYKG